MLVLHPWALNIVQFFLKNLVIAFVPWNSILVINQTSKMQLLSCYLRIQERQLAAATATVLLLLLDNWLLITLLCVTATMQLLLYVYKLHL
jgi:hypothetical protein